MALFLESDSKKSSFANKESNKTTQNTSQQYRLMSSQQMKERSTRKERIRFSMFAYHQKPVRMHFRVRHTNTIIILLAVVWLFFILHSSFSVDLNQHTRTDRDPNGTEKASTWSWMRDACTQPRHTKSSEKLRKWGKKEDSILCG